MNNSMLGKKVEKIRKHRIVKFVNNDKKKFSNGWTKLLLNKKHFPENLKAIEMRKIQFKMNKPVYWVFLILNLSKIQMWKL